MSYKMGKYTIEQRYVHIEPDGSQTVKSADDFTAEELKEIERKSIGTFMNSLGYYKDETA